MFTQLRCNEKLQSHKVFNKSYFKFRTVKRLFRVEFGFQRKANKRFS